MVLLTSILFPLMQLGLLFTVSFSLKFGLYFPSLPYFFRAAHHLDEWGMVDVYLIAILISIIKIGSIADFHFGTGFFTFVALTLLTMAAASALSQARFWQEIEKLQNRRSGAYSG
jgi:paraquat-inducible protein A